VALGLGLLAVVLGGAVVALGGGATRRAISSVRDAEPSERSVLVEKARRLIQEEKDPGRRSYLLGQLDEARGDMGGAVSYYRSAVKAGDGKAEGRLVDLLEHPKCGARAAAADAIADLKLSSARGELEDLAEDGGPDDEGGTGLLSALGCNSKRAAKNALKRLGEED
jgi:hypothetical protein